jgi:hypothetical protein
MQVSCLVYFSTLKMAARHIPPEHRLSFNGLHGVIFQNSSASVVVWASVAVVIIFSENWLRHLNIKNIQKLVLF